MSATANNHSAVVAVHQVREGANANTHLAVELETGEVYGLKAVTRVGQGCLREKIAADLAILLGAPNSSPCFLGNIDFGPLSNRQVSIIQWLPTARQLQRIPAEEIKLSPLSFFEQFGEWTLFCGYFGVSDRANGGNWLYDTQRQLLVMVDLEDTFSVGTSLNFVPWAVIQYAGLGLFRDLNSPYPVRDAFIRGVKATRSKHLARVPEVEALIRASGLGWVLPSLCYASEEDTVGACVGAA